MTSNQITVFSKLISGKLFETTRVTFDGVSRSGGFRRLTTRTRHTYRIDGEQMRKTDWFILKQAAAIGWVDDATP